MDLSQPEVELVEAERRLFGQLGIEVRSRFLVSAAGRIRVLECGIGRPLLMIHGGSSIAAAWAPLWAELQASFRMLAPDRPGCGLTYRQDYRGVDFRRHAVDFVRTVMDGVELGRATLVGNSMGGFWALLFALAYPERVDSVVLLGEPAGSTPVPGRRHRLGAVPLLNRPLFATVARPRPDARIFRGLMADPSRAGGPLLACAYAGSQLPGAGTAWRSMLELVAAPWRPMQLTYALLAELSRIEVPVHFLWGDRDFAPVVAGEHIAGQMPGATFEVVPDAGHLLWLDQPAAAARLLLECA